MKPLSLALVRQRYAEDGGAERFVGRLLQSLQGQDVRITLVTREWKKEGEFGVLAISPFFIGRLWRDWSFARAVCRSIGKQNFDLVQSHERISCCDIYRAGDGVHREWLLQRARAVGHIVQLGLWLNPYHIYVRRAERRLFESPRLRAVICNSQMVKDEIKHYFGLPDERLHVIYSGVDTRAYHPDLKRYRAEVRARHGIGADDVLFLFVGSGFERKGLAMTIDALARVPGAHLLVVGRDKKEARYRARAKKLGIADRVHFAGVQRDVKPYYGAADVFVLPTLYDPFPNVVLEALASGLPVVTSRKCGAAELIEEGKNGFVCDALNIPLLRTAMNRLMSPETRTAMSAAARHTAEGYDLSRMSQNFLNLYRASA